MPSISSTSSNNNNANSTNQQRMVYHNNPYSSKCTKVWVSKSPKLTPSKDVIAVHEDLQESSVLSQHNSISPLVSSTSVVGSSASSGNNTPKNSSSSASTHSGTVSALALTPKDIEENSKDAPFSDQPLLAAVTSSPTVRAPSRTMQHLLQNVPYLFLDTVSTATAITQERSVSHNSRVGDTVSTWACPSSAAAAAIGHSTAPLRDVFVAQLPFDMPLSALQELADLLLPGYGVQIIHAAPHYRRQRNNNNNNNSNSAGQTYDGCAFVKMTDAHASLFIENFHKRVLFDVDGVWVASTDAQVKELTDYCAWMQTQNAEQRRKVLPMPTPFSAITAEFAMRATRSQPHINSNYQQQQYNTNVYAQQPQQQQYYGGYQQQQQQYPSMSMMPPQMPCNSTTTAQVPQPRSYSGGN